MAIPHGYQKPYRPPPRDFRERYAEIGWGGIVEHYRTNWRCVARWIEECGGDELRARRSEITGCQPKPERQSQLPKLYVAMIARTMKDG